MPFYQVAPVVHSLSEAYAHRDTAWPRLIIDDDRVVGFVMAGFDPSNEVEASGLASGG